MGLNSTCTSKGTSLTYGKIREETVHQVAKLIEIILRHTYNIFSSFVGVRVAGQRLSVQKTLHYKSRLLLIFQNTAMSANYFTVCSCI